MTWKHRIGRTLIPALPFNRRTFDTLRFELNAMLTRVISATSPRHRRTVAALRNGSGIRANLGSGGTGTPGWTNLDIGRAHLDQTLPWDIRRSLPFASGTVRLLFVEHVFEHLEFREDVPRFLSEARRVLEPRGRIRIIVPDAGRWLLAYASNAQNEWDSLGASHLPADMPTRMALVNHVFHQDGEHFFGYDSETLHYVLRHAGFCEIETLSYGVSRDQALALDQAHHRPYSLYVEAVKRTDA